MGSNSETHGMEEERNYKLITADQQVKEVLMGYPTTALIFPLYGRIQIDQSDPVFHLFPTYPPMTVGEYVSLNRIDKETLLRLLNAAAESEEYSKSFMNSHKHQKSSST